MSFEHGEQCIENDARCGCYDTRIAPPLERELAAVTAERDALLVLRNRWMAPAPPTGTKP